MAAERSSADLAVLISSTCGWIYVVLWSISYYPQPRLNFRRKSTEGYVFDFPVMNVAGSASYTISTALFLWSPDARSHYALRHPRSPTPTIQFNDFCYAFHSLLCCSVTLSQFWPSIWGWKRAANRTASPVTWFLVCGSLLTALGCVLRVIFQATPGEESAVWSWLDVAYILTYAKLVITIFKYIPQVTLNWRRKSTKGFTIIGVLLDFIGGLLSLLQLVIDSSLQEDWSGLTGNPVKFGLANLSMVADVIFMVQHFILYGPVEGVGGLITSTIPEIAPTERQPLLP